MPRHGDNIEKTENGRWEYRFKQKVTEIGPDGAPVSRWVNRKRAFDCYEEAATLRAEVKLAAARGEVWQDKRLIAVPVPVVATMKELADAYCAAASDAAEATIRFRRTMMNKWLEFAGETTPVGTLTGKLLRSYKATLPSDGRKQATAYRKVFEVERMWMWGYKAERRADYPGITEPMRITGTDSDSVRLPAPVVRVAVPTVEDVDKMIGELKKGWAHGDNHRRVALLCRYTGIRISRACTLSWRDIVIRDDGTGYIVLRKGAVGMKKGSTRVIPLHPALIAEMRTWGERTGKLFLDEETAKRWSNGEACRDMFRAAWERTDVDADKWDVPEVAEDEPGERAKGSPCHAIRSALFVHLLRAGVNMDHASYLIGHATPATQGAYVPESAPETSPWWKFLVAAIATIPAYDPPKSNVVSFAVAR